MSVYEWDCPTCHRQGITTADENFCSYDGTRLVKKLVPEFKHCAKLFFRWQNFCTGSVIPRDQAFASLDNLLKEAMPLLYCNICKQVLTRTASSGFYCHNCGFPPLMQDTFIRFYCPDCQGQIELNDMRCPQCKREFILSFDRREYQGGGYGD